MGFHNEVGAAGGIDVVLIEGAYDTPGLRRGRVDVDGVEVIMSAIELRALAALLVVTAADLERMPYNEELAKALKGSPRAT